MDLPTYTNIWRIEKRLYKLYDFRLPMPLPINWIAVFAGITIPYIILLIAVGLPFNHSLVWLYVLPPGVLTWLTTRPVIENKRLPELVESQARYLTEPRTWVRLVPLSEKDQMILTARVWRSRPPRRPARPASGERPAPASRSALPVVEPATESRPMHNGPVLKPTSVFRPEPAAAQGQAVRQRQAAGAQQRSRAQEPSRSQERSRVQERSRATTGRAPARRPPLLPGARSVPPVTPVVAPDAFGLPASLFGPVLNPALPGRQPREAGPVPAMPDVVPAAAAAASSPPVQAPVPSPVPTSPPAPMTAPTSPPVQAPRPARVVVPVPAAKPDKPPVWIRAGAPGGASLELSHDGPGRRPVTGGQSAEPGAPAVAPVWPSQPLHAPQAAQSVTPVTPVTLDPPAGPVRPAPAAPLAGPGQSAPSAAPATSATPAPAVSLVRPGSAAPLAPSPAEALAVPVETPSAPPEAPPPYATPSAAQAPRHHGPGSACGALVRPRVRAHDRVPHVRAHHGGTRPSIRPSGSGSGSGSGARARARCPAGRGSQAAGPAVD